MGSGSGSSSSSGTGGSSSCQGAFGSNAAANCDVVNPSDQDTITEDAIDQTIDNVCPNGLSARDYGSRLGSVIGQIHAIFIVIFFGAQIDSASVIAIVIVIVPKPENCPPPEECCEPCPAGSVASDETECTVCPDGTTAHCPKCVPTSPTQSPSASTIPSASASFTPTETPTSSPTESLSSSGTGNDSPGSPAGTRTRLPSKSPATSSSPTPSTGNSRSPIKTPRPPTNSTPIPTTGRSPNATIGTPSTPTDKTRTPTPLTRTPTPNSTRTATRTRTPTPDDDSSSTTGSTPRTPSSTPRTPAPTPTHAVPTPTPRPPSSTPPPTVARTPTPRTSTPRPTEEWEAGGDGGDGGGPDCPLMIDLDNKMPQLDSKVNFLIRANDKSRIYWPSFDQKLGFIAFDFDRNGSIDNDTELFGNNTNGQRFENGYVALAELRDANKDGFISGEELEGLLFWSDLNHDGKSDPKELKSLFRDLNIMMINVSHVINDEKQILKGGYIKPYTEFGAIVYDNGQLKIIKSFDLWFEEVEN
ncbi:MAG: hypothetical protein SFT81_00085 [Candidatus Caenarcaniphilales bacterium]|nr:hypothetical protein [Candidatus Caenarcaniphilales bacterium]